MKKAGIDTESFKPHSTRAASTSAALRKGIPLEKSWLLQGGLQNVLLPLIIRKMSKRMLHLDNLY